MLYLTKTEKDNLSVDTTPIRELRTGELIRLGIVGTLSQEEYSQEKEDLKRHYGGVTDIQTTLERYSVYDPRTYIHTKGVTALSILAIPHLYHHKDGIARLVEKDPINDLLNDRNLGERALIKLLSEISIFHDSGKLTERIIGLTSLPRSLDADEARFIEAHPTLSAVVVEMVMGHSQWAERIAFSSEYHHRLFYPFHHGYGYPKALTEQVRIETLMETVCDNIDAILALNDHRPYKDLRDTLSARESLRMLIRRDVNGDRYFPPIIMKVMNDLCADLLGKLEKELETFTLTDDEINGLPSIVADANDKGPKITNDRKIVELPDLTIERARVLFTERRAYEKVVESLMPLALSEANTQIML